MGEKENQTMSSLYTRKVFIIGLPRTGTTSLCAAFLEQEFNVAHTAFTRLAFEKATVVADAPVFSDYRELDTTFPDSKFIYLGRDLAEWLPSMQLLQARMLARYKKNSTVFSPVLLSAYRKAFGDDFFREEQSIEHLRACYSEHARGVESYFASGTEKLLTLNIASGGAAQAVSDFIGPEWFSNFAIPCLNAGGRISDWRRLRSPLKIDPNLSRGHGRKYFSFSLSERPAT